MNSDLKALASMLSAMGADGVCVSLLRSGRNHLGQEIGSQPCFLSPRGSCLQRMVDGCQLPERAG